VCEYKEGGKENESEWEFERKWDFHRYSSKRSIIFDFEKVAKLINQNSLS
jgi:hypothetical protein